MTSTLQPHLIHDEQRPPDDPRDRVPWRCSCGAGGFYGSDAPDIEHPGPHLAAVSTPILQALSVAELTAALHRGIPDPAQDPGRAAGTQLLIAHGFWLSEPEFRDSRYLTTSWSDRGDLVVEVAWGGGVTLAGSPADAVLMLEHFLPPEVEEPLWQWLNPSDAPAAYRRPGPLTSQPRSALALLRIAATVAGSLPVRLQTEAAELDERDRLLVAAALTQMLTPPRVAR
ncbi:hypothetical protein [Krasilnikovia sp. MM14-A1259]|uniref:hypothetical protein n=1 Tax=Krasilnikovia sp. MM14-A1259 TaxID=3373539 RepID=UPI00382C675C